MIYGAAGAKMAVVSIDEEKPWKRSVLLPLSPWKGIYGVSLAIIRPKAQPNPTQRLGCDSIGLKFIGVHFWAHFWAHFRCKIHLGAN